MDLAAVVSLRLVSPFAVTDDVTLFILKFDYLLVIVLHKLIIILVILLHQLPLAPCPFLQVIDCPVLL